MLLNNVMHVLQCNLDTPDRNYHPKEKEKEKMNYLISFAVFIAQLLAGQSKQLKQMIQTEHNIVKKKSQLAGSKPVAIYKCGRGFELGSTEKQIQVVVRAGLEPGLLDCESDTLTTPPHYVHELTE